MAVALVGSPATGQGDGSAGSIASSAKSTTTGNCLVAFFKYEGGGPSTDPTDTAGNDWAIASQGAHSNGSLKTGIAYALDITANAANVVTADWSGSGTADWRRIIVYEFSGVELASALDDSDAAEGSGTTYSTPALTATQSGVAVAGVGAFAGLSGITAGGTPAFTHSGTVSDTFLQYLISAIAQSITPGGSSSTSADWAMRAIALKGVPDAAPPPDYGNRPDSQFLHDGRSSQSAMHSLQGWMPLGPEKWFADELEAAAGGGGPTYVFNPLSGRGGAAAQPLRRH